MLNIPVDFIKPTLDVQVIDDYRSVVTLEPLERGFGHTLGTALRRVLISSIYGAAITKVRVEGVQHEYSTIDGVQEDMVDILLNLKKIAVEMKSGSHAELKITKEGPGKVTAGDIEADPNTTIKNPEHIIATLNENATLEMSLTATFGRGYVSAAALKQLEEHYPLGEMFLDASYGPVERVNYVVENARVEQRTDLDKLVLKVTTNGTVDATEIIKQAATILQQQFGHIAGDEPVFMVVDTKTETKEKNKLEEMDLREIGLSERIIKNLTKIGVTTVAQLVEKTEADLYELPSIGKKSVEDINLALNSMELVLAT